MRESLSVFLNFNSSAQPQDKVSNETEEHEVQKEYIMSRLNATIKLFFCIGELFFLLVSVGFVGISSLIVLGQINALAFPEAQELATYLLLLSAAVLLCTCFGCSGALRQTIRHGCSGRRILLMHLALILAVLHFSYTQFNWLEKREISTQLVIKDPQTYAEYDGFEQRLDKYANRAYFQSLCSNDPTSTWVLNFVDKNCPESMSSEHCALTMSEKDVCDTSCIDADLSEISCMEGNKFACPYHKCRVEILEELFVWLG